MDWRSACRTGSLHAQNPPSPEQLATKEDSIVTELVGRLFGDEEIEAATPIASGWTNRVLRLTRRGGDVVARLPRPGAIVDVAARRREAEVWSRAAAAAVVPAPLLIDVEAGILVTPVVAERNLRALLGDARPTRSMLDALGTLVARFHAIDPGALPAVDPVARLDADLGRARRAGVTLDAAVDRARARIPTLTRTVLAHHDLIPANILVGERLWLVDLEASGPGDPEFDLVTLASALRLDAADEARLFAAAGRPVPERTRLQALRTLFQLSEHAWAAARLAEGRTETGVREQYETSLAELRRGVAD
ncbi:MAG: phosphotransferase [Pseudomonadales bacterium]|nr:phosphotransferase [Pseudomonadales bacterium]